MSQQTNTMRNTVRPLQTPEEILPLLRLDPVWCGYALADLAPPMFSQCTWLAHANALVLRFHGFNPPILIPMGDPADAEPILAASSVGPVFAMVRPQDLPHFEVHFTWQSRKRMHRMTVIAPVPPAPTSHALRRLNPNDDAAVQQLFALGDVPAYHLSQLESGIFYGITVADTLVSVAGTHIAEPTQSVADVGNVFTHPEFRGQGMAETCTRAVCNQLQHQGFQTIFLNVEEGNDGASRIYERLGFTWHGEFFMGPAIRKAI